MRIRNLLLALLAALLAAPLATAQQTFPNYTKGKSQFPNFVAPYVGQNVPPPVTANSPRIDQMMKDGKVFLSMDDAIALALENNLDLAIARYNLPIADTDILRTAGGGSTQGVSTGVVQNTPGGTGVGVNGGAQGTGAGGTSAGAGGAGAGASGLVTSSLGAGPSVPNYDPIIQGTFSIEHGTFPQTSTFLTGKNTLQQNTGTGDVSYFQGFATGTNLNVGFTNQRMTTSSLRSDLVPSLSSSFRATVTQHLLQGFGILPNRRFIVIAKNNREISDVAFRQQIISTVSQIEDIYWDLVNAYEDMKVKEGSLALAQKLLGDNQKQVQIGTLAPIEIVRAQAQVAASQQDLIVSQTNLQLQELLVKNAIARNLADPALASAPVIPTDTMQMPAQEPVVPVQDLINQALQDRPEVVQARIDLTNRDITKKAARNSLMPSLDLNAWYGGSGLSGSLNPTLACGNPGAPAPPNCIAPGSIPNVPGGFGDAFSGLFNNNNPDYGVGLTLTIPIRNRVAQATQIRSELEYRQAQMRLQQLYNQIRIQVRNAQFAVQQNRARVDAAEQAVVLAQQTLDAEQKKYALGASTTYNVLQTQRDLVQAQVNLVSSKAAYEKSRVDLDLQTAQTLQSIGIDVSEAENAKVTKLPHVPTATPRSAEEIQQMQQPVPATMTQPGYQAPAPTPAVTPQANPPAEQPQQPTPPAENPKL